MIIIHHRVNNLKSLNSLDVNDGAEIDVRYHHNDLVLHHDPFEHHNNSPTKLDSFLREWKCNGPLILNLKTEGIEDSCINLMEKFNIHNWFFLDMSMPFFVKYSMLRAPNKYINFSKDNLAVRYSDFEAIEYAISFAGEVGWAWVDSFHKFSLDGKSAKTLKDFKFKICLVSPELHNHPIEMIKEIRSKIEDLNITIDAVCTKHPDAWTKICK